MSATMAGNVEGCCAAITAAMRTVPAESAVTSACALATGHSACAMFADVLHESGAIERTQTVVDLVE